MTIKQRMWNVIKKQTPQYRQRKCKYCDTTHQPRKCPAFGVQCSLCNKHNHFCIRVYVCWATAETTTIASKTAIANQIYTVIQIWTLSLKTLNQIGIKDKIHVTAVIDNTSLELKVDSGAKCYVISTETIKSLVLCKKPQLNTKKKMKLVTYSKDTNETMGTCVLNCKISDVTSPIEFQAVRQNSKSILGLKRTHSNWISSHFIRMFMKFALHHVTEAEIIQISLLIFGRNTVISLATLQDAYQLRTNWN